MKSLLHPHLGFRRRQPCPARPTRTTSPPLGASPSPPSPLRRTTNRRAIPIALSPDHSVRSFESSTTAPSIPLGADVRLFSPLSSLLLERVLTPTVRAPEQTPRISPLCLRWFLSVGEQGRQGFNVARQLGTGRRASLWWHCDRRPSASDNEKVTCCLPSPRVLACHDHRS